MNNSIQDRFLDDPVAVVNGAGRGIGEGICDELVPALSFGGQEGSDRLIRYADRVTSAAGVR